MLIDLQRNDLLLIVRRLPLFIIEMMKQEGSKLFMAGGFIRASVSGEVASDMDFFCPTAADAERIAYALADKAGVKLHKTDNAYTVRLKTIPAQFIHRWTFAEPADVVPSFDFTIAKAVVWWDGEYMVGKCDAGFYPDLAAKRLVYCSPVRNEDAGGSLLRVLKFYQRGYRIPLSSLAAVIARLNKGLKQSTMLDYQDEEKMTRLYAGLLYEVDPLLGHDLVQAAYEDDSTTTTPKDDEAHG